MRRHKRKASLDIDLTSLLDVIFIVLMVVMCNRSVGENKTIDELTEMNDQLRAENTVLKDRISIEENKDDLVSSVVVFANYETNDPKTRHIYLARGEKKEIEDITITPENEEEKFGEFREKLQEYISGKKETPVFIVLDESQILYRDHLRLDSMIGEIERDNSNLYSKEKQE